MATYRASYSTGIYGSYTVGYKSYNMNTNVIIKTPTTSFEKKGFRKNIELKRDVVTEDIVNGNKYNVKLIQEWRLQIDDNKCERSKFYVCHGSVVEFSGECIVNSANQSLLFEFAVSGGGVDRAISNAGGNALNALRKSIPIITGSKYTRCKSGDAKITRSGYPNNRLKCDYVIHAVGPNYNVLSRQKTMKMEDIDKLLYSAYVKTMCLCKQNNIKSVGICLISSSIFRGQQSLNRILEIGVEAIRDCIFEGIEVYLIAYSHSELKCLTEIAPKVLGMPHCVHYKM